MNLKLGKSTQQQPNEKASTFAQGAPVKTTQPPVEPEAKAEETLVETTATEERTTRRRKHDEPKVAPWRHGLDINPNDLKLIQRPFNNNISQENYLRLVYLKGLGSVGFGANKDTFASMLDEALTEYTTRRLKALGDNYDV